jgi:DNA-binding NtrC family response regulator
VALLTAHRYEVKAFAHGAGVLEHLKRHDADLVITDLFMPEFDGMELQATLRTRHPELKVIVISGGSCHWAGALQAARQLGAAAVLPKPFEFPELLAAIESVLGRRGERQDDQVEASHDVPAES